MRVVLQRVLEAAVRVPREHLAEDAEAAAAPDAAAAEGGARWVEVVRIGPGLLVLAGFAGTETPADLGWVAEKIAGLRVFARDGGFDLALADVGGELLVVSQFTLLAELRGGRRPDFARAAPAAVARPLYDAFVRALEERCPRVSQGVFGAPMRVALVNDGPATLVLERG